MLFCGRQRLDGPPSSVRFESDGNGALRVAVTVVNASDAAKHSVRIVLPPPPGFGADAGSTATSVAIRPGAAAAFAYAAAARVGRVHECTSTTRTPPFDRGAPR